MLLTGHTGFKGAWLSLWLSQLGAKVSGIALPPNTSPNLYDAAGVADVTISHFCDIRDAQEFGDLFTKARPEVVFHLAAQPLVRESYVRPIDTFETNFMGTVHVLEAVKVSDTAKVVIVITTDKVYENNNDYYPFRETDRLGGHDPYSASKAASEIIVESYRKSYFFEQGKSVCTARAGNVIGGGDWAIDRLLPDAVRAWQQGGALKVRNPNSVRPWQHVLEPLNAYMCLAEKVWANPSIAGAYNFGPDLQDAAAVGRVIEIAREAFGDGAVEQSINSLGFHEAAWLALETSKSRISLNISPKLPLLKAISLTMNWYRAFHKGMDARELCLADIAEYEVL